MECQAATMGWTLTWGINHPYSSRHSNNDNWRSSRRVRQTCKLFKRIHALNKLLFFFVILLLSLWIYCIYIDFSPLPPSLSPSPTLFQSLWFSVFAPLSVYTRGFVLNMVLQSTLNIKAWLMVWCGEESGEREKTWGFWLSLPASPQDLPCMVYFTYQSTTRDKSKPFLIVNHGFPFVVFLEWWLMENIKIEGSVKQPKTIKITVKVYNI